MRVSIGWMSMLVAGALTLAALPAGAQAPVAGGCVGKARLRGPLWDTTNNQLEPGLDVALDDIARVIKEDCKGKSIVVESHAYEMATPELNQKLSELRVALVRTELEKRGVPARQLLPIAFGDTRPLGAVKNREDALENRRITFRVVSD